jgi:hypothetical protein
MAIIYVLYSGMEGAMPPVSVHPDLEAAFQQIDELVSEYRRVFEPRSTVVVVDTEFDCATNDCRHGICRRVIVKIVDARGSVEQAFTLTIHESHLLLLEEKEERQVPAFSCELPTEPGDYKVTSEWLNDAGEVRYKDFDLCTIYEEWNSEGDGELVAQSMLFETLWPTQGDEIDREHLTQPLKELEDIKGVRLRWQRLIPETRPERVSDIT